MELHGNTGDYAWGPNGLDNIISQVSLQFCNYSASKMSYQCRNCLHYENGVTIVSFLSVNLVSLDGANDSTKIDPSHVFNSAIVTGALKVFLCYILTKNL